MAWEWLEKICDTAMPRGAECATGRQVCVTLRWPGSPWIDLTELEAGCRLAHELATMR